MKFLTAMTNGKAVFAIVGIENQTEVHYAMPVKSMIYDALSYSSQVRIAAASHSEAKDRKGHNGGEFLSGFYKDDRLIPVITLVIYFGAGEWDGPTSLYEMLGETDEKILSQVDNYHIHLIIPSRLSDEELSLFQSSLREVLAFIKYSEDKEKLQELVDTNPNYAELDRLAMQVINECTNAQLKVDRKKKEVNMCKALDDMRQEAHTKGKEEGRDSLLIEKICQKLKKNKTVERIADELEETVENIRGICELASDFAPEYSYHKVYEAWQMRMAGFHHS